MTDPDKAKIEAYKKLIREKGVKKALDELEASGITYTENFTKSHKTDPIFSSPLIQVSNLHLPKFIGVDMSYNEYMDGNIYPTISFQSPTSPTRTPVVVPIFNLTDCIWVDEEPTPNYSDNDYVSMSPVEANISNSR